MTRVAAAHHSVTLGSRASSSAERSTRLTHTRVVIVLDKRALVNAVRPVAEMLTSRAVISALNKHNNILRIVSYTYSLQLKLCKFNI